jgi:hypothetical protein
MATGPVGAIGRNGPVRAATASWLYGLEWKNHKEVETTRLSTTSSSFVGRSVIPDRRVKNWLRFFQSYLLGDSLVHFIFQFFYYCCSNTNVNGLSLACSSLRSDTLQRLKGKPVGLMVDCLRNRKFVKLYQIAPIRSGADTISTETLDN